MKNEKINEKNKEENKREMKRRRRWLAVVVVLLPLISGGMGFVEFGHG